MKKLYLFIIVFLTITNCDAQSDSKVNEYIVKSLKENKFNFEIFELAFCLDEIFFLIENDSTSFDILIERINNAFNVPQKEEIKYIHSLEFDFFREQLIRKIDLKIKYPETYSRLEQTNPEIANNYSNNFAEIFKSYIEYPEQVDDICLIMLICNIDCKYYDNIQNDKIASWKYNNWIEYGFEEFRYYPGTLLEEKRVLNNRMFDYIVKTSNCRDILLVDRSISMIEKVKQKP